jgi:L-threonylcarbamoyladenylate synthase
MINRQTAIFSISDLSNVVDFLQAGDCVAVPTETVYGLAANALNVHACQAIFKIKGRPLLDPLIVHCANLKEAQKYGCIDKIALQLADAFWPGPVTLVVRKKPIIPEIVTAGLPSVALRVPAHPLLNLLLSKLDFPLAAPSANPFGYISPTSAEHVLRTLGGRIAAVLDGGPCAHGLESAIIDVRNPKKICLLRPGPIDCSAVESVIGQRVFYNNPSPKKKSTAQLAPGNLDSHYSPRAILKLFAAGALCLNEDDFTPIHNLAKVFWQRPTVLDKEHLYWLTEAGDSTQAAHNLFALLNRLDAHGYTAIHCEMCPSGLPMAAAINDRLTRAATKAS